MKPSDLPKNTGAWRREPVKVLGIKRLPLLAQNEADRRRIDGRANSTTHAKETTTHEHA